MKTPIIVLLLFTGLAAIAAPPVAGQSAGSHSQRSGGPGLNQMPQNPNNQGGSQGGQNNAQNSGNYYPTNVNSNPNNPGAISDPNNPNSANNPNNINNINNPNSPNNPVNPNNINNPNSPNNLSNPNNPNNYNNPNNLNNINNPNDPNSAPNIQNHLNNPAASPSPFNTVDREGLNPNTGSPGVMTNAASQQYAPNANGTAGYSNAPAIPPNQLLVNTNQF